MEDGEEGLIITSDLPKWKMEEESHYTGWPTRIKDGGEDGLIITGDLPGWKMEEEGLIILGDLLGWKMKMVSL